jgi:hypothetical protein
MTPTLKQLAARHQLRLARQRLRECEQAFHKHLADDALPWIDEIAKAEQAVTEARARVQAAGALAETEDKQAAGATVTVTADFEKGLHSVSDVDKRTLPSVTKVTFADWPS